MTKALIALSSYNGDFYPDGVKTGVFATEALHPFETFKAKDIDVDFVSETGTWGYDQHSLSDAFVNSNDRAILEQEKSEFNVAMKNVKKPSEVDGNDYQIFFASAGHASLFDYPTAKGLVSLAETVYKNGGVVSAVCHGPAIFKNMKDPKGESIIKGKTITGFTDKGEVAMLVDQSIKQRGIETIEEIAASLGATYKGPEGPFDDFTIVDGKIITGTNPASALGTAQKAILALSK